MRLIAALLMTLASLGASAQSGAIRTAGIDHVGIDVPDLAQAEAFLSSTFGCEPITRIGPFKMSASLAADRSPVEAARVESLTIAMLRCGSGANLELFEYRDSKGGVRLPAAQDLGASHVAFYTDDVQAGVAYLRAQGIKVLGEPMTMTSGDTEGETWVHFQSPWGSEMELVGYPAGKGYEKKTRARLWNPRHPGQ